MCEGRITGELMGEEIDQNKIMQYAIKRNISNGRLTS